MRRPEGDSGYEFEAREMPPLDGISGEIDSRELEEVAGASDAEEFGPADRAEELAALEAFDEIEEGEEDHHDLAAVEDEYDEYFEDSAVKEEEDDYDVLGEEVEDEDNELAVAEQGDSEDEMRALEVPGLSAANEALAEDLAAAAATTESDAEAQSLVGGITIHIIAPAPFRVKSVAPIIIRRTARLVRKLRRSPRSRILIRTIPTITRRTVATLVRKARKGRPVNNRTAVRVLTKHTHRTLADPKRRATALARHRARRRATLRARGAGTRPRLARRRPRQRRRVNRRARRLA